MVPYGEVHSTPEVMADISATPSSEKMTNLITDYSGDPVTLDDNLCISTASRKAARRSRKAARWMGYNRPHRSVHRRRRDPAQLN